MTGTAALIRTIAHAHRGGRCRREEVGTWAHGSEGGEVGRGARGDDKATREEGRRRAEGRRAAALGALHHTLAVARLSRPVWA